MKIEAEKAKGMVGVFGGVYADASGKKKQRDFDGIQDLFPEKKPGHNKEVSFGGIQELFEDEDTGAMSDGDINGNGRRKSKKGFKPQRDPSLGVVGRLDAAWRTSETKLGYRRANQVSYGGVEQLFKDNPGDEFGRILGELKGLAAAHDRNISYGGVAEMFEDPKKREEDRAKRESLQHWKLIKDVTTEFGKIDPEFDDRRGPRHEREISYGGVKELFNESGPDEPTPGGDPGSTIEVLELQIKDLRQQLSDALESKYTMIDACMTEFERLRAMLVEQGVSR